MDRRLMLDEKLREIQNKIWGYQNTYFEPPENMHIKYNAIVYERTGFHKRDGNDHGYIVRDEYQLLIITKDPEDTLPRAIAENFSLCRPGKSSVRDNLWHFPFTIYF